MSFFIEEKIQAGDSQNFEFYSPVPVIPPTSKFHDLKVEKKHEFWEHQDLTNLFIHKTVLSFALKMCNFTTLKVMEDVQILFEKEYDRKLDVPKIAILKFLVFLQERGHLTCDYELPTQVVKNWIVMHYEPLRICKERVEQKFQDLSCGQTWILVSGNEREKMNSFYKDFISKKPYLRVLTCTSKEILGVPSRTASIPEALVEIVKTSKSCRFYKQWDENLVIAVMAGLLVLSAQDPQPNQKINQILVGKDLVSVHPSWKEFCGSKVQILNFDSADELPWCFS